MIGDYQSAMTVDLGHGPIDPLPITSRGMMHYINYRMKDAGTPLTEIDNKGIPLTDVNGKQVYAIGGWESQGPPMRLSACTHFIHEIVFPKTCGGAYEESCPNCELANPRFSDFFATLTTFFLGLSGNISQDGKIPVKRFPNIERCKASRVNHLGIITTTPT